jgi:geranylgeranyl diphosphate synthase type II
MTEQEFRNYLKNKQSEVDKALDSHLPAKEAKPGVIHESMRYSALAEGKRIRPILCLASCEALGGNTGEALPFACALEMIHTYSLVHDDLPCMDDDDFRRGRPTNHKVYGEAIAVLAGDALLTLAFEIMSKAKDVPPNIRIQVIEEVASGSGTFGLVGGQVADLTYQGKTIQPEDLEFIHLNKTARLIQASVKAGAMLANASPEAVEAMSQYGKYLGLAFQITDDLLDVLGNAEKMGKAVRKDADLSKSTYPGLFGIENSKRMAEDSIQKALDAVSFLKSRGQILEAIARLVQTRQS